MLKSRRARRAQRLGPDAAASLPWFQLPERGPPPDAVLIAGAGLAGCNLAHALARRGQPSVLIERGAAVATGASGNPAGLAKPYVTRAPTAASAYLKHAHRYLMHVLATDELAAAAEFRSMTSLQLTEKVWEDRADYRVLDASAATREAGTRLDSTALAFDAGGWLNPAALCRALLHAAKPCVELATSADITHLHQTSTGWHVRASDGRCWQGSNLVLATGTALTATPWTARLPLEPARGQISRFAIDETKGPVAAPACIIAGRRYVIPDGNSVYVGATFDAGDRDSSVRACDNTANYRALQSVIPDLPVLSATLSAHAGVRATTPDRMPMVGPVPDLIACNTLYGDLDTHRADRIHAAQPTVAGLSTLGGFGARGIVSAPFAADLLADWLCGGKELQTWAPSLLPIRFAIRALRRGQSV